MDFFSCQTSGHKGGAESRRKTMRHAATVKGSIMTMAKFKKIAGSVGLVLGVIALDKKFNITGSVMAKLGL